MAIQILEQRLAALQEEGEETAAVLAPGGALGAAIGQMGEGVEQVGTGIVALKTEIKAFSQEAKDAFATVADTVMSLWSSIGEIQGNVADAELMRLQAIVDATEEGTQAREDAEERLAQAKRRAARDEAKREKVLGLFTVGIETAKNIVEVFPDPILIAAAAAIGVAQAAAIASKPIPAAQFGGSFTVPPGNNNDGGLVRVNSGERVDVTPARQSSDGSVTIKLQLGDREFVQVVEDVFNKKGGQIRNANAVRLR